MKLRSKIFPLLIAITFCNAALAEEEGNSESPRVENTGATNELEGISVIGNRELPKALVIVPWKAPEPGDLDGSPLNSLINEVLGPLDKDVHKRKVSFYEQYH